MCISEVFFIRRTSCPIAQFLTRTGSKTRRSKATKSSGSKSGAKIIGEQSFVRGGEGVDDFEAFDLQPVVHIFR